MQIKIINVLLERILIVAFCISPSVTAANSYLLSQEQQVYASSIERETLPAKNVVDGDTSTRWASVEGSDAEWIYVDLGVVAIIDSIVLNWETAYGKGYEIQISNDLNLWTTIFSTTNGNGGMDELSVSGTGRYVKMYGTQRGTQWGYSLWEFKIYGDFSGATKFKLNTQVSGNGILNYFDTSYSKNTWAEIEATADSGWKFIRWDGDLSGNKNPTAIKMDTSKSVIAFFERKKAPIKTPVDINGQLHVDGVNLVNQYGYPIQLRGMSTHGIQWFWNNYTNESLDVLAYEWGADILRISMYVQEGGWETNPTSFTSKVNTLVEKATERGMYALVDWHQLEPSDPNYNLSNAKIFFTEIATAHKDKNNIIYDICNEPSDVSWDTIESYADSLIPVIRAIDSDAIILIGTHGWSSLGVSDGRTHQDILNNPVNFTNIMYGFHVYAASHQDSYLNELDKASKVLPIFVTEWGTQVYDGNQKNDFEYSQKYIDLMAEKKISWTNWNYSDDFRSGAVWKNPKTGENNGPWTDDNLKPAGIWIKDKILNPADDFPTDITSVSDDLGELNSNFLLEHKLYQNNPNPFNPTTSIQFNIVESGNVSLKIYNVRGQLIKNLIANERMDAGQYKFNVNMDNFSSSTYFYQLLQDGIAITKKMILMK